ncbi:MAG: discoidin domain-containing protein [Planctomycetes bacterium]|nr:discoidin domain-containing protein [Planctomycetota bacterium]
MSHDKTGIWNPGAASLVMIVLVALGISSAKADFTFGKPVNLRTTIPVIDPVHDAIDCCSSDGLEIYLQSDRPGGYGGGDIWVIKRDSIDAPWRPAEVLGPTVSSTANESVSTISGDGLTLYFHSNRSGGQGGWDIWMTTRTTRSSPWGQAVNVGPGVNSARAENQPCVSPDNLELYFIAERPEGYGGNDIYVSRRAKTTDPWGDAVNLGSVVNTAYNVVSPGISPDGLLLFFQDFYGHVPQPGGYGGSDLWMTRRATLSSPWQTPINLGPVVNSSGNQLGPRISGDGSTFYFFTYDDGNYENWQAPIIPVLDLNRDNKVDANDMTVLVAYLGKSDSVCDIGPCAWGDGVVDERDVGVLTKSLATPDPRASDVPCDVTLSWISPSFAQNCDVYLGTSWEAVSSADRTNPQGVLVSQGQQATTYNPRGLLELSRTYYWRVDFVIAGPVSIVKGPVLQFTTAALTYPIRNVTATASSAQRGNGPEKTVDGSGLDQNDGHSINATDMWWSLGVPPNWIQYQFDRVYTLHEMWVWNMNQIIEPFMGFGAKTVKIEYSTDGTAWTPLANVPEFAKAPGKPGYTANIIIGFAAVPAKFVKLTIEKNWGGKAPQTGLSEVRFFCIQNASAAQP